MKPKTIVPAVRTMIAVISSASFKNTKPANASTTISANIVQRSQRRFFPGRAPTVVALATSCISGFTFGFEEQLPEPAGDCQLAGAAFCRRQLLRLKNVEH